MKLYKVNSFSMEFQEDGMSFMSRINNRELARYCFVVDESDKISSIKLNLNRLALKDHPEKDREEIRYITHTISKSYEVICVEEWIDK